MSHCHRQAYCTLHDCICGCANCNPLKSGQLTHSGFRKLLKKLKKERELTPDGYDEIINVLDIGLANDPTPDAVMDELNNGMRAMGARQASGACMARGGPDNEWCCLPGNHIGPHRLPDAKGSPT